MRARKSASAAYMFPIPALFDRRRRLIVRLRKGKWIDLTGKMLFGVIEVYNASLRPNTISSYRYLARDLHGKWIDLEAELYEIGDSNSETKSVDNETPLVIGPYSGAAVRFRCFDGIVFLTARR
jgi:hypothetical protein